MHAKAEDLGAMRFRNFVQSTWEQSASEAPRVMASQWRDDSPEKRGECVCVRTWRRSDGSRVIRMHRQEEFSEGTSASRGNFEREQVFCAGIPGEVRYRMGGAYWDASGGRQGESGERGGERSGRETARAGSAVLDAWMERNGGGGRRTKAEERSATARAGGAQWRWGESNGWRAGEDDASRGAQRRRRASASGASDEERNGAEGSVMGSALGSVMGSALRRMRPAGEHNGGGAQAAPVTKQATARAGGAQRRRGSVMGSAVGRMAPAGEHNGAGGGASKGRQRGSIMEQRGSREGAAYRTTPRTGNLVCSDALCTSGDELERKTLNSHRENTRRGRAATGGRIPMFGNSTEVSDAQGVILQGTGWKFGGDGILCIGGADEM
ncbi:hypothetical protein C8R44DRAFT_754187 [Mycena epipterygia]|nr:hypothetical protein C8R44DRAFT_754187 [Mycena epipterygia]